MINFDALTLKLFDEENKNFFIGAKIQKIQQPTRSELIFTMRNKGKLRKFYINFNPSFYHICFMSEENEKKRGIKIPKTAPMFCMLLRKYIQNSRIINVQVPKYERIFEIYFEYYDEINEKKILCLAIELMGKYSNVILYNYDNNVIIGCAHNVSSEKSRERELSGLLPYTYPKKQNRKNLLKTNFQSFHKSLNDDIIKSAGTKYNYLTIAIAEEFYKSLNPYSNEKFYYELKKFLSEDKFSYCISNDYSKYFLFKFEKSFEIDDVNSLIDNYFSFHQERILKENLRQKIIKQLNSQLKKLYSLLAKQEEQINKLPKAIEYKAKGDIIMANLHNIQKIQKYIKLYDFSDNEVIIQFDTDLTAIENANHYYSLYKKTKTAYEHSTLMSENTKSEIKYYEEQKFYAENANDIDSLNDIYAEISPEQTVEKGNNIKVDFVEYKGFKIFIGKNKKQNDFILSKIASSEDFWFHPLNCPGAHILVKSGGNINLSDDVILKAAKITKEYSSQKNNSKTSVIYTKRKYVKKANNKIAFVTYKNETEIIV